MMGGAAARAADVLVVTDDNPRDEDPAAVRAGLLAGARKVAGTMSGGQQSEGQQSGGEQPGGQQSEGERGEAVEVAGRADAIAEAVRLARPGDTVAVLGKGHEQGQEVAGVVHPFDDRVVLVAALEAAQRSSGATA